MHNRKKSNKSHPIRAVISALLFPFCLMLLFSCQPEPSLEKERALRNKAEEEAAAARKEKSEAEEKAIAAQREQSQARMEAAFVKGLAVSGAVMALIMGTALGSRARKDSHSSRKEVSDIEKPETDSSSRSP